MENFKKYEKFQIFSRPLEKFLLIDITPDAISDKPPTIKDKILKILQHFYCGLILMALFSTFPEFIYKTYLQMLNSAEFDIDMFASGFTISTSLLIIAIKFLVIYRNKPKIFKILEVLMKEYPTDPDEISRIERYGKNYHKFNKYFAYYIYTTALLAFIPLINFFKTGEKKFAFDVDYPVDINNTSHYLIAYFYSIFCSVYSYSLTIASNLKINGLMMLTALSFYSLKSKFDTLKDIKDKKELHDTLNILITRHCELDEAVVEVQKLLSPVFLIVFIFTSFEACLTAFQCSVTTDPTKFFFNITFFSMLFMWIALQSYFGQMLNDSHDAMLNSVYNCEWEDKGDIEFQKSIILMLAKIQNQEVFKIAKIIDISLENVTRVLASTCSYYTLCRQVYMKS